MPEYIVYTDGGSRNHGNVKNGHVLPDDKSSYAFLVTYNGQRIFKYTEGFYGQTNNRMELLAVLRCLQYMQASNAMNRKIRIVSDSKYVDNAINKHWIDRWHAYNFTTRTGERKNADLWRAVYDLLEQFRSVSFKWTKGHAKNRGNIFVDHLLNRTMDGMK